MSSKVLKTGLLLNRLQNEYGVFFVSSSVDGTKSPPTVNAWIRLPIHKEVNKVTGYISTPLTIKIDRALQRLLSELEYPLSKYRRHKFFQHNPSRS